MIYNIIQHTYQCKSLHVVRHRHLDSRVDSTCPAALGDMWPVVSVCIKWSCTGMPSELIDYSFTPLQ